MSKRIYIFSLTFFIFFSFVSVRIIHNMYGEINKLNLKNQELLEIKETIINIDKIYPGIGSGLNEIIDNLKEDNFDNLNKDIVNKPLIDKLIKILIKLHGLKNYDLRYPQFVFPVKDVLNSFIRFPGSEFGVREINYERWVKKNNKFLISYNDTLKHDLYTNPLFKIDGEYVLGSKRYEFHDGLDIKNIYSDTIIASASGRVIKTGYSEAGGNYILIEHVIKGELWRSYYGHLDEIIVIKNQIVNQMDIIGSMGNTGMDTEGKHLHWLLLKYDRELKKWIPVNSVMNSTWGNIVKKSF